MEPVGEDASKLLDDLSEDELDSAFSRVVSPAPRAGAVAESVAAAGERLHSLVARSEVQRLAEDELARARESAEPVEWFLANGGRPSGPFDLDEVRERWASGQIGPDTACWSEGLTGWMPICRVPRLAEALAPAPAAPADLTAAVPQQELVAAPSVAEALKAFIEGPAPVVPTPPPAPAMTLPPPLAPAPAIRQGVSHGRVALYVGLSATIGAIAGGALVGLFAVQLLRFLPGTSAPAASPPPPLPPVVQSAPLPTPPAPVAPKVEAPPPPPAPEPVVAEHKPEPHHARPTSTPAPAPKKEKAETTEDADAEVIETSAPPPAEPASTPEVADAFDQAFGPAPAEDKPRPSKSNKTVYVPPAPPTKAPKAQLGQSEIMQVVVANKDQVVKCLDTARESDPGLSGKLLMRWTVMPSGETDSVEALPGDLSGSELAHCVTRAIQGWKFPQHSAEQAPITFPFVF
ncbi:MAG TPA: AgmX/PglI C-terminal domain-containing protein [Myxococcaceae bacterium]|nr:AgmX/PglI C-terminal domain-containing protein [Myxococcaceae bacterium]